MPYSAIAVANIFLKLAEREGRKLTNMQLQKLVYIAQGWALALLGRPLFYDNVHAWQWGPVIPTLYQQLRKYGAGVVTEPLQTYELGFELPDKEMAIIEGVWSAYGRLSGPQLSGITHKNGTPWSETWKSSPYGVIDTNLIAQHYRQLTNERHRTNNQPAG